MLLKATAVLLIFLGETLSIGAELFASKWVAHNAGNYLTIFILGFVCIGIGGAMLVAGYMLGYLHLKNIWIIAAISIGSILVVEPVAAYALFRELPTLGAAIGLIFGVLGTLAALFL